MDEKKYSQLYQALLQEVLQFHVGNQRRIRKGMLSLLLVPLVFLVLLFLSEGSRVIFLLLWIVSMFGIAAYLIAVEYIDYEMQNKVKQITKKEVELDQLTALPAGMPQLLPLLRGRGQEPEDASEPPQAEQESFARSAAQADEDLDRLLQGLRGADAAPEPAPVSVPENPASVPPVSTPVPPVSRSAPQPAAPDLNQTLAGLQTDVQQLARGLESLSNQLGRIFQYMEQQGNGSKEERK